MIKTGKNSTYKFVKIQTSGGQHSCPEWNKSVIPPVSMIVITEVVFIVRSWMNDFPVMRDLVMRTELWDRHGANIASRYKEMYGLELFLR